MYNDNIDCNKVYINDSIDCNKAYILEIELEDTEMSVIHGFICEDGIALLSDSRSAKKVNGAYQFDDTYEKQYYFANLGLGIISAGFNEFGGNNFVDICKYVESHVDTSKLTKDESIHKLLKMVDDIIQYYADLYKGQCQIILGYYSGSDIPGVNDDIPVLMSVEYSPYTQPHKQIDRHVGNSITFGVRWIQSFLVSHNYNNIAKVTDFEVESRDIIDKLIAFSNSTESPSFVGGQVNSMIIRK